MLSRVLASLLMVSLFACPRAAFIQAPTPTSPDRDQDNTPNEVDSCPNDPEDFDGFQDEDGCPDPDNDQDGVLDAQDRCPSEPTFVAGSVSPDGDGCHDDPQLIVPVIDPAPIAKIYFDKKSAKLQPKSLPELDDFAKLVLDHPDFVIEVEGHSDDGGSADAETKLSTQRAKAVMDYLISKGAPRQQLMLKAQANNRPADPTQHEKNRRVELHLVGP